MQTVRSNLWWGDGGFGSFAKLSSVLRGFHNRPNRGHPIGASPALLRRQFADMVFARTSRLFLAEGAVILTDDAVDGLYLNFLIVS